MKKVLFITYYWPPSGKASLHWPLDIIRNLPKEEVEPIILTVEKETFTQKDVSLLTKVDPSWKVIRAKAIEPFNIYRKLIGKKPGEKLIASETISMENKSLAHRISIWIRMNLFIPDARIGWYLPAVQAARKFLLKEKVDVIISIGPPHTTHLVANRLSKKFSIPFFPVFIDPWVDIVYYKNLKRSSLTKRIDNDFEKSVVENAKEIIFVTNSMKDDYVKKYPKIKDKSFVLYWGYNEKDFEGLSINSVINENELSEENVIVHAGNIFDYQNPKQLWKLIRQMIDNGRKIKIKFIGTVGPEIRKSIIENGLSEFTNYAGFLSYPNMLSELFSANYLMVCASEPRHVPGKLFEYLRSGKPIIAFGNGNEEVRDILTKANAGMLFGYEQDGHEFFESTNKFNTDISFVRKFDRRNIAHQLAEILNNI